MRPIGFWSSEFSANSGGQPHTPYQEFVLPNGSPRADLVMFRETWFKPDSATLVLLGDTTLAEMTLRLEELFAG